MECPACAQQNRPDAAFCLQCGRPLLRSCGGCGRELPAGARFCDACGQAAEVPAPESAGIDPRSYTPNHLATKILTARRALEGERKQVTILFADVAGSTAIAERLDPEDLHGIMDTCFRLLMEPVHRYEGTVIQFTGDGIMALFGAPIAHEDAPERAVRAALGMQEALRQFGEQLRAERGIDFRMRIGVNTGPVVVGKIGDDLRMDYTAIGDTTNLAARLQTAAAPGAILISEATYKLVTKRFVSRSLGPLVLKGKALPVPAWEVERAAPRAPLLASLDDDGLTALVGRTAELAALDGIMERVRDGHGQVVFIVGEAGIGKSRLTLEFRRQLDGTLTWWQGQCISFGRGIPFLPIVDSLKGAFAIDESDDDPTIIAKVQQGLTAPSLDGAAVEPYVRLLLAVDPGDANIAAMDASARRFATFEALKRLLLASAAQQPVVLLIEDLHWIDPASDEFLTYVVDAVAAARVLLLCTYRPGYRSHLGDRSYVNRLTLQALSPVDTGAVAAAMLQAPGLSAAVRTFIANKADGNPFFAEEITKSLLEVGALRRAADGTVDAHAISETVLPNTIQDVIMARIDRLGDEPKRAIQVASVIGREFAVRLLQRASQLGEGITQLVGELRALELIYEKLGVPELAYMFKHALTHEVAYESILLQRRKQLHGSIAGAIEDLYGERLSEYWETLAHHLYRAEDWPKAFEYLVKAGDKARDAFANREAVQFYDRALEAAMHLDVPTPRRAAILASKGRAHQSLSDFAAAIEAYRTALTLLQDPVDRARISAALGETLWYAHEFDAAIAAAEEALRLASSTEAEATAGEANRVLGLVCVVRGDLAGAGRALREARRLAGACGNRLLSVLAGEYEAMMANWRGEYRTAIVAFDAVVATLKGERELLYLAEASSHFSISLGGAGEVARALSLLEESIALTESVGEKFWQARMWNTRGWLLGEFGADEAAEAANRRCLEIAEQLGALRMAPELIGNAACNLADLALMRGNVAAAAGYLERVAAILDDSRNEWMTWRYGMHFRVSAAELALARGDAKQAGDLVAACLQTAQRTGSRRYIVRASRALAAVRIAEGQAAAAEPLLAATLGEARALGNPPQLWLTLLAYGRILRARGQRDAARAAADEGRAIIDAVAGTLPAEMASALHAAALGAAFEEVRG